MKVKNVPLLLSQPLYLKININNKDNFIFDAYRMLGF